MEQGDRWAKAAEFKALRERISELRKHSSIDDTFLEWYRDVLAAIDAACGPDSQWRREFAAISFNLNPDSTDRIRQAVQRVSMDLSPTSPQDQIFDPSAKLYRGGLAEAREQLLA